MHQLQLPSPHQIAEHQEKQSSRTVDASAPVQSAKHPAGNQLRPSFNITAQVGFVPEFFTRATVHDSQPRAIICSSRNTRSFDSNETGAEHAHHEGSKDNADGQAALFSNIPRKKRTALPSSTTEAGNKSVQPGSVLRRAAPNCVLPPMLDMVRTASLGHGRPPKRRHLPITEHSETSYPSNMDPYHHMGTLVDAPFLEPTMPGSGTFAPPLLHAAGPYVPAAHPLAMSHHHTRLPPMLPLSMPPAVSGANSGPIKEKLLGAPEADELAAEYVERLLLEIQGRGVRNSTGVLAALEAVIADYRTQRPRHASLQYSPQPQLHPIRTHALHGGPMHHRLSAPPTESPTSPYNAQAARQGAEHMEALQGGPNRNPYGAQMATWPSTSVDALNSLAGVAFMMGQPTDAPVVHWSEKPRRRPRTDCDYEPEQDEDAMADVVDEDEGGYEQDDVVPRNHRGAVRRAGSVGKKGGAVSGSSGRQEVAADAVASEDSTAEDSGAAGPLGDWQSQPGVCKPDSKKRGSSRKRLRQIEVLLAMNLLKEKDVLHYKSKGGKIMASGTVKGNGICCHRCGQIVGCTEFERCAGSGLRRPCDNIFTENGTSLQELLQKADVLMLSGAKAMGQQLSGAGAAALLGLPSGTQTAANSPSTGAPSADGAAGTAIGAASEDEGTALQHLAAAALDH